MIHYSSVILCSAFVIDSDFIFFIQHGVIALLFFVQVSRLASMIFAVQIMAVPHKYFKVGLEFLLFMESIKFNF